MHSNVISSVWEDVLYCKIRTSEIFRRSDGNGCVWLRISQRTKLKNGHRYKQPTRLYCWTIGMLYSITLIDIQQKCPDDEPFSMFQLFPFFHLFHPVSLFYICYGISVKYFVYKCFLLMVQAVCLFKIGIQMSRWLNVSLCEIMTTTCMQDFDDKKEYQSHNHHRVSEVYWMSEKDRERIAKRWRYQTYRIDNNNSNKIKKCQKSVKWIQNFERIGEAISATKLLR